MWSGAKQALEEGINNVAFLRTNIELIDRFFAKGEVSEIWITFPDPQMKKVRKRLTSTRFMQLYQNILSPEGLIHLKSDSPFMYTYTCEMVKANGYPRQMEVGLIGSCTNSSYQDLSRAASIARQAFEDKIPVASPLIINPGSEQIRATAERDGMMDDFVQIGAVIMANAIWKAMLMI